MCTITHAAYRGAPLVPAADRVRALVRPERTAPLSHSSPRRGRRALALVASLSLATAGVSSAATAASAAPSDRPELGAGRYVVLLADTPAAAYEGDVPGFARTRPSEGRSYGKGNAEARYERFLAEKQDRLLARVGARASQRYTVAVNGFSASLTAKQATELATTRGVLAVTPDVERSLDTTSSPDFLGLTGAGGTWAKAGGVADAGSGTVVGIIDSGIWPESASFDGKPLTTSAAPGDPKVTGTSPTGEVVSFPKKDGSTFTGLCQAGEEWAADDCNTKLISAQYFATGFVANVKPENRAATEQISTRDGDGHGTHTASTAAGNVDVPVTIDGASYGTASGVAPGAKVAAYKVCWEDTDPNTGGCYTSDSVAAIDQAVKDGVDVLNYSISGATSTVVDAVEFAFFNAAAAGVFVAASAGNSGPTASTVAHNSPWLTTVAASTHSRTEGTVVTGDGKRYKGASISKTATPSAPLVLSSSIGGGTASAADVALCAPGSLLAGAAAGKIVVCDRGVYDRVAKSAEVKRVGGLGVVLANTNANSLDSDVHTLPTVHVDNVAGAAIKSYVGTAGAAATASFQVGDTTGGTLTPVPQIAGFSSRGPALANGSDLLKPDISAPGVSVIAAVAPPAHGGRDFDVLSGTSMSSPHIAGLAALLLDINPTWTPMTVKSAMMTTAYDLKGANGAPATDPFAQGAGHVNPARFVDPGLVVTSSTADWAGFYAGQGLQLGTAAKPFAPVAASDLNVPSIAVSRLAGTQTVARTFTALRPGRYTVSADVPGFSVATRGSVPFAKAGQSQRLEFAFTRTTAPLGTWAKGFITLKDGASSVRLPVALRPVALAAPAEVTGTGTSGSTPVALTAGFTGSLPVTAQGLAAGDRTEGTLAGTAVRDTRVTVPADTAVARFDVDAANAAGDFDLFVYRVNATGAPTLVASSATGAADEQVTLRGPRAAEYLVRVENYAAAPGETTSAYALTNYVLDPSDTAGALAVTPNPVPVTQGTAASVSATWSGLTAGTRYLGLLSYGGAAAPASTLVSITG